MEWKKGESVQREAKVETTVQVEEGPPPGWQSKSSPPKSQNRGEPIVTEIHNSKGKERVEEEDGAPPVPSPIPSSEMAQMVCGSCRCLLSYPKGSRHVQCASCQTTNFVLEAHELGIVKCGGCAVLLMYPHAASSVRCASCRFVTEIGEHNKRPAWSVQQGNSPPPPNPVC